MGELVRLLGCYAEQDGQEYGTYVCLPAEPDDLDFEAAELCLRQDMLSYGVREDTELVITGMVRFATPEDKLRRMLGDR